MHQVNNMAGIMTGKENGIMHVAHLEIGPKCNFL